MDRTLISWSVPNIISINLMAWAGFLLLVVIFSLVSRGKGNVGTAAASSGQYQPTVVTADDAIYG